MYSVHAEPSHNWDQSTPELTLLLEITLFISKDTNQPANDSSTASAVTHMKINLIYSYRLYSSSIPSHTIG